MKPEDFNRLCAEFMGYTELTSVDPERFTKGNCYYQWVGPINYYHDANQRNKVIEKMEISVERDHVDEEWISYTRGGDGKIEFMQARIDRNESEIACIELVLEGK